MSRRSWILGLCILVIAVITLLAPGLDQLRFEPARPLAFASHSSRPFLIPDLSLAEDTPLWKILVFWLALVVNMGLVLLVLSPELRKRLLRQLFRFAVGVLAFLLLLRYRVLKWPESIIEPSQDGPAGIALPPVPTDGQSFQPPYVAPWVAFVVTLIGLWLVSLVLYFAYRKWNRHRAPKHNTLGAIAEIARASLAELTAGRNWGDVVMQAYARMTEAVRLTRGLERESSTTPREFAARLVHMGLPAASVEELTSLFESVRYGGRTADARAEGRASACLESILGACRVKA